MALITKLASRKNYLTTCSVTIDEPRQRLLSNEMTTEVNDAGRFKPNASDDATESLDPTELVFLICDSAAVQATLVRCAGTSELSRCSTRFPCRTISTGSMNLRMKRSVSAAKQRKAHSDT